MAKTVTITDNNNETIETTVSDDDTASHYERLPFEAGHIVIVTVTDARQQ
ncbi:hypothetical protein ACFRKD_26760 [Streptomyces niveus]